MSKPTKQQIVLSDFERQLLAALQEASGGRARVLYVDDVARQAGLVAQRGPRKKLVEICEAWADRGLWEYATDPLSGWLTAAGLSYARPAAMGNSVIPAADLPSLRALSSQSPIAARRSPPHIRWMIKRDLDQVLAIERESFDFPWTRDDLIRYLQQRNTIGIVAEIGDQVAGFMVYGLNQVQICLHDFAVGAEFRRRGVGTALLAKLSKKLS